MSSVLDINTEGAGWNYSDSSKPNYMTSIQGTVVEINEVQSRNYMTKQPEFWPDGNPKLNIEFVIQGQSGRELPWVFSPKSTAAQAVKTALLAMNPNAKSIAEVGGYLVEISTQEGQWGQGRPRPWNFKILGMGQAQFRGVGEYKPAATPQPQQQGQQPQQQQGQAPAIVNGYYEPPTPQPQQQAQPQAQQGDFAPQAQPQVQQQAQPQVVQENGVSVYDQDIPF